MRWLRDEMGKHHTYLSIVIFSTIDCGNGRGKEVSRMQAVIDSGLFSGLEAMSELLDELYGSLD